MFNKRPDKNGLTDRLRQLSERKPQPLPKEASPSRKPRERPDRRHLFRQGFVIFESGQKLRVAVKNLSNTGARIEFLAHSELPDEVLLSEPTLNLRRRARVVWQRDGMAGLEFVDV